MYLKLLDEKIICIKAQVREERLRLLRVYSWSSGAGIAQSVLRLATGWTTEVSEFESRWGQEFSPDRPDRLWGPPNPLTNGYRGLFPRG
jgi:hypothetical protein